MGQVEAILGIGRCPVDLVLCSNFNGGLVLVVGLVKGAGVQDLGHKTNGLDIGLDVAVGKIVVGLVCGVGHDLFQVFLVAEKVHIPGLVGLGP